MTHVVAVTLNQHLSDRLASEEQPFALPAAYKPRTQPLAVCVQALERAEREARTANAGLGMLAPFGTVDEQFLDLHFDANVKGLFFSVQKGLPLMKDGGSIILNGSIADIRAFPAISVYSAIKAAVRSFARTWTNDLRDRRIRVNVLSPGHIDTPIMESLQQGEALVRMKKQMENNVPLGRSGDPDEIAKAVFVPCVTAHPPVIPDA